MDKASSLPHRSIPESYNLRKAEAMVGFHRPTPPSLRGVVSIPADAPAILSLSNGWNPRVTLTPQLDNRSDTPAKGWGSRLWSSRSR